ncbi:MAG: hypothetical protein MZV64_06115 [Ignavibacteriales bacterium]|nr:hypothetical protein [Ignavibacteriales bacterium]
MKLKKYVLQVPEDKSPPKPMAAKEEYSLIKRNIVVKKFFASADETFIFSNP